MKVAPETIKTMERVAALQTKCRTAREAVQHHHNNLKPLQDAHEAAAQAVASNDTAQALALAGGDDAAARKTDAEGKSLGAALIAARVELDWGERVGLALLKHLRDAEADLASGAIELRGAVQQHGHELTLALAEELREAAAPFIVTLLQISRTASAANLPYVLRELNACVIPDLPFPTAGLVQLGRVKQPDGSTVLLASGEIDAAIVADVSAPRRLLADVEAYVPFNPAAAEPKPATWAGRNGPGHQPHDAPTPPARTDAKPPMVRPAPRRGRAAGVGGMA